MIRNKLLPIIVVVSMFLGGCTDEKKDDTPQVKEVPPLIVETISVAEKQVPIWLRYTGKTEATKRVEVRARVPGRLDQVMFQEGDYIKR